MAISFIGAGTHVTGTGTSLAVPYPTSGIVAGDVAVLLMGCNSATVVASQTGWSNETRFSSTGSTLTPDIYAGTRVCDGTENSTSFTATIPAVVGDGQILIFRGVDAAVLDFTTQQIDKTGTSDGLFSASATTTRAGVALVYSDINNGGAATWTPPSVPASFTEDADLTTGRSFTVGHLIWTGAGATGTVTATASSNLRGCGVLLGLRPAPDSSAPRPLIFAPGRFPRMLPYRQPQGTPIVNVNGDATLAITATTSADGLASPQSYAVPPKFFAPVKAPSQLRFQQRQDPAGFKGDASLPITVTLSASGTVGVVGNATSTITVTESATGSVGVIGDASLPVTVASSATGVIGTYGDASSTITVGLTAGGLASPMSFTQPSKFFAPFKRPAVVLYRTPQGQFIQSNPTGDATLGITVTLSATGTVGTIGNATLAETVTLASTGTVGVVGNATLSETVNLTAAGLVGASSGATRTVVVTFSATGTVASVSTVYGYAYPYTPTAAGAFENRPTSATANPSTPTAATANPNPTTAAQASDNPTTPPTAKGN